LQGKEYSIAENGFPINWGFPIWLEQRSR